MGTLSPHFHYDFRDPSVNWGTPSISPFSRYILEDSVALAAIGACRKDYVQVIKPSLLTLFDFLQW